MQLIKQKESIDLNGLTRSINLIVSLRRNNREEGFKRATAKLYNYLKALNYKVIDRNFLNSFFSDNVNQRTRRRVLKVILKELIKEGKIRKTTKIKTTTFFRTSTLYTNDHGSFAILMEKNEGKPRHAQGVYSLSSLSIRKVKQPFKTIGYEVI